MKVYLWSNNNGNASWIITGRQGPRQGTKPESAKIVNFFTPILLILVKMFISQKLIHGCRFFYINNTNELRLLVSMCFWVIKEESTVGQSSLKNKGIWSWTRVFVSSPQPLHHTDNWIASFYIVLFKSCNYGNYVRVHTQFVSCWN